MIVLLLAWLAAAHAQTSDGILGAARKHMRVGDGTEETITDGTIAVDRSRIRVDTEADAASDDLDTITGAVEGQLYFITAEDDDRTVVLKHQTGNIECPGAADIALAEDDDFAIGLYSGGKLIVLWQRLLAGNVGEAGGGLTTYYINCNCDDDSNGSADYCTIESAAPPTFTGSEYCHGAWGSHESGAICAVDTVVTSSPDCNDIDPFNLFCDDLPAVGTCFTPTYWACDRDEDGLYVSAGYHTYYYNDPDPRCSATVSPVVGMDECNDDNAANTFCGVAAQQWWCDQDLDRYFVDAGINADHYGDPNCVGDLTNPGLAGANPGLGLDCDDTDGARTTTCL